MTKQDTGAAWKAIDDLAQRGLPEALRMMQTGARERDELATREAMALTAIGCNTLRQLLDAVVTLEGLPPDDNDD